MLNYTE